MYDIPTITGLSNGSPVLPSYNLIFPGCWRSKNQSFPVIFRALISLSLTKTLDASAHDDNFAAEATSGTPWLGPAYGVWLG